MCSWIWNPKLVGNSDTKFFHLREIVLLRWWNGRECEINQNPLSDILMQKAEYFSDRWNRFPILHKVRRTFPLKTLNAISLSIGRGKTAQYGQLRKKQPLKHLFFIYLASKIQDWDKIQISEEYYTLIHLLVDWTWTIKEENKVHNLLTISFFVDVATLSCDFVQELDTSKLIEVLRLPVTNIQGSNEVNNFLLHAFLNKDYHLRIFIKIGVLLDLMIIFW